jgi:hypothetical protein
LASPDKKAFLLRLPPDVWAQLERLAASELRSVNGQIEYLLREGLAKRMGPLPPGDTSEGEGERAGSGKRKRR